MSWSAAGVTYLVILPAELPDKSLLATMVLGTRHRGEWVLAGVAGAFAVHVVLAVAAGGLLTLLPRRVLELVVTLLFALAAAFLLRPEPAEDPEAPLAPPSSPLRIAMVSFGVVFVGEWGDVTQLATANLAAHYDDPVVVGAAAFLALMTAAVLAVLVGARLTRLVPLGRLRAAAGLVMAGLAVLSGARLVLG